MYKDWFFTGFQICLYVQGLALYGSSMKPDGYWSFRKGGLSPPQTWQFFANTQNRGIRSKSKNRSTLLSTLLTAGFIFLIPWTVTHPNTILIEVGLTCELLGNPILEEKKLN
jgi:hypothetical protein